ncbi:MAG TPA: amidohydrolase family protein, partial [Flavobacteriaceae bacterium]|nr:amidohydrolase family protein [Flavobacteriaceae bacterium]
LTTINDAGLQKDVILLIDSLQKENKYPLRVYAMISGSDPETLGYFLDQGIYKTDGLSVRSAKVFTDGALGSRGAALREPYSDDPHNYGLSLISKEDFTKLSKRLADANFQMNSHAIGDSANHVVLTVYEETLKDKTDARWKVEHAQILSPEHFAYFSDNIIASVQPTHATSDMSWAEDRLGADRIRGAYAYQDILKYGKRLALGTDFPVEKVTPMFTFYSAVARQDHEGNPAAGFLPEQRLTREQTLRGMTIWAAYSNFEEKEKGSLEPGKFADFIVMDEDLMEVDILEIPHLKVQETYVDGKRVYKK